MGKDEGGSSLPRADEGDDAGLSGGKLLGKELDEGEVALGEKFGHDLASGFNRGTGEHLLGGEFRDFGKELLLLLLRGFAEVKELLGLGGELG